MSETTRDFLVDLLRGTMNLDLSDDQLNDDVPLGSSGIGLESLDFTELVMHAEATLGVSIPDEDATRIASFTVGELLDYLDGHLVAKLE
jgi:acyl carrier protein